MAELQFEVTEPTEGKFSLRTYLWDKFRPRFGGGFESYSSGRGPSVVVTNQRGEACVIKVVKTVEEARDQAAVIERDYRTLPDTDWCEKYHVPQSFVQG